MSDDSKLLMLGLRGSGKTTFLAALWHYLESNEIEGRLTVPRLQPDRDYLNSARNNWLALKPVGRTSMRSTNEVSLSIFDRIRDKQIEISLPDLSGESFHLQWATRKAPKAYVEFARDCSGAFLFVHPSDIARTHVIKPTAIAQQAPDHDESLVGIRPSANWTPAQSSTQVQLVDVVQLLLRLREARNKMRLAIIVSAWDVVRAKIPPTVWLDGRLPLLSQFIRANPDRVASEVFGVSAQGGDLTQDRANLLRTPMPSSRCHAVRGGSLDKVPFTDPLLFLLDDSKAT